jgi:protein-S-isoprenylcysteine O-methyltransferase Ste14
MLILHGSHTSWLRNSGVLNIPGLKLVVMAWLAQVIVLTINVIGRVSEEDRVLKLAFKDEWERWAKAVRYRLVPGVY